MKYFRKLSMLVFLAAGLAASGAEPTLSLQGAGTAANPYLLTSAADIVEVATACAGATGATSGMDAPHFEGVCFAVTNDIDMSGVEGFYGIGSAPEGSSPGVSWYFAGIIDGQGHTISNMKIDGIKYDATGKALSASKTGSRSYVGFVGTMKSPGAIGNLNFDATCSVAGYTASGTIVGQSESGVVISDCTSAATVKNINKNSGGIVGYMKGSSSTPSMVTRCVFTGKVMENYEASGGIAGVCERGIILKCANTGEVVCQSFNSARAENKQNLGGGIVGSNAFGTVQDCVNAGRVEVSLQKAAGIVAYNRNVDCKVLSCVNLGQIVCADTRYTGGVVGHNTKTGPASNPNYPTVKDCYYDSQLWGELPGYQVVEGTVTPLATATFTSGEPLAGLEEASWQYEAGFYPRLNLTQKADLIKAAAATYVLFADGQSARDFYSTATVSKAMPGIEARMARGTWFKAEGSTITALPPTEAVEDIIELTNGGYRMQIPVYNAPVSFAGSGTSDDPYIITTAGDLELMARACNGPNTEHYAGVHFRLDADIDMSGHTAFTGIASKATRTFNSEATYYFSGNFDGNGHTISGLTITGVLFGADGTALEYTEGSTGNVGLFGALGTGATVSNLTISHGAIAGYYNVGAVAGYLDNGTTITNCRVVNTTVSAYNKNAGGIAGATSPSVDAARPITVTGCIVSGTVKANSEVAGGIVGDNRGSISECVNLADVSVGKFNPCVAYPKYVKAGGIAGNNGGDIISCLNLGNVASELTEAGGITGFNNNAYHMGNLKGNISGGQVTAADVSDAGALVGTDYRITTSTSTPAVIAGNRYDSRYCALRAAENMDKEGMEATVTQQLVSGEAPDGAEGGWTYAAGRYPLPAALATDPLATAAAATYITVEAPATLYNFGAEASIATTMPLTATVTGSDVFAVTDDKVTAAATDDYAKAELRLANGTDYTRTLTIEKTGRILPGAGTAEEPYRIATPDDYNKLATFVLTNQVDFDGSYFVLTADLDFSDAALVPVGSVTTYFNGTLDGAGHTVSNVTLDVTGNAANRGDAGLFGFLGQNATVKNLTVAASEFKAAGTTGAIAGHSMGRIENCTVGDDVAVTGVAMSELTSELGTEIGGAVGRLYPGSVTDGVVNRSTVTGERMVGGIAGSSRDSGASTITNCTNEGPVLGMADREIVIQGGQQMAKYVETMTGGIAGRFTGTISGCVNEGYISSKVCDAVGGILGKAFIDATLSNNINRGEIHVANAYAGGIVGITTVTSGGDIHTVIDGCENHGLVGGMTSMGGIAGVAANGCKITASANCGEVHPLLGRGGGIIGEVSGTVSVADCYNTAVVNASMLAAGVAGDVPSKATLTVERCFNTGSVTAGNNGGAAGIANSTSGTLSVTDSYNAGDVSAARFVGGIAGRSNASTITRCYNAATVASTSDRADYSVSVGNIAADASSGATITDCCYLTDFGTKPADAAWDDIKALTIAEMADPEASLGTAYVYSPLALPMLAGHDNIDAARAYTAWYEADADKDADSDTFVLSSLEGVTWTAGGLLEISGTTAVATGTGEATLTATCGEASRTHTLTVADMSGAAEQVYEEGCSYEWYDLNGVKLAGRDGVRAALRVTVRPDGSRRAEVVRMAE